ncbi:hypothetical protein K1T71_000141 [Dendrolimus kikuchii]|uniref:Uncharacterized protein n=1 Tax=Dendrolimus kikuchii TaxID=765133 RepID=A0ACC1DJ80_9NEOP|nr:hypothetical protein K1T71_000141 [Dendrolimus kikuchii]
MLLFFFLIFLSHIFRPCEAVYGTVFTSHRILGKMKYMDLELFHDAFLKYQSVGPFKNAFDKSFEFQLGNIANSIRQKFLRMRSLYSTVFKRFIPDDYNQHMRRFVMLRYLGIEIDRMVEALEDYNHQVETSKKDKKIGDFNLRKSYAKYGIKGNVDFYQRTIKSNPMLKRAKELFATANKSSNKSRKPTKNIEEKITDMNWDELY